ncbi:unnamed protein product [Darwinula stevensoni]|uniref:U2 snRNP-associated SURP motif-containing protein n=1 Tax=Darwinula stevensoni TaxID=69355 RepID=A0A7R8ZYX2_9CRUS|nr:unnamed protein product [Darwinula stevensoni]CAG0881397.1 unnamed protein product [Darwinula stevensoni]
MASKSIPESKLKAFSIGVKRTLSKKELEELRKKQDEEAAAQVFEEFVATFQDGPSKSSKVWVKAGTFNAGTRAEDTKEKGKLYKPTSKLPDAPPKRQERLFADSSDKFKTDRLGKKREPGKRKTNLELFKEELKIIQEERQERHRLKKHIPGASGSLSVSSQPSSNSNSDPGTPEAKPSVGSLGMSIALDDPKIGSVGSYDLGDPSTTNLYLGNLHTKISEKELMELFGKYGPLASVKIMWPRTDEEKQRGKMCGFVAFMTRRDAERALKALNGKEVMGFEMKLGWGKGIPIPPHPIYIPPVMLELTMPPPPSGLPFNAQPAKQDLHKLPPPGTPYPTDPEGLEEFTEENGEEKKSPVAKELLYLQSLFLLLLKHDYLNPEAARSLLALIHRMVEFVVREGPMFEAMIMNKELGNPMFRFLFDNQSPAHVYYRWKLFSILQGDSTNRWRTEDFRMFQDGSVWRPPPINPFANGMPDELVSSDEDEEKSLEEKNEKISVLSKKGSLSNAQRDRLEDMLRGLTPERIPIGEAMVFCVEHADAAEEICDCITESLSIMETPLPKKIARLYLVSDILHNCTVKVANASFFRKGFEGRLEEIFSQLRDKYKSVESRLKAEAFKAKVLQVFRAWEGWALYPVDILIKLQNLFLGIAGTETVQIHELDGAPLEAEDNDDLDGVPLDGLALLKAAAAAKVKTFTDDIDGVPLNDEEERKEPIKYAPSKWETVDPEDVAAQAMTTSKWDLLEQEELKKKQENEDIDGVPMDATSRTHDEDSSSQYDSPAQRDREGGEERRARLREIELKVIQYQDELESGQRSLKERSIAEQVEQYRQKLLRKMEKELASSSEREEGSRSRRSRGSEYSPDDTGRRSKHRSKSRSRSPGTRKRSHHRSRSRSPSRSPKRKHKKKRY